MWKRVIAWLGRKLMEAALDELKEKQAAKAPEAMRNVIRYGKKDR